MWKENIHKFREYIAARNVYDNVDKRGEEMYEISQGKIFVNCTKYV